MEINDYVRTKNGIIEQLTSKTMLYNHYGHFFTRSDRDECYAKEEITKHSKDIIELVEVGDYVNGRKVIFTKTNFPKGYCKNNKNDVVFTDYNDEYGEWFGFESDEIETVLTHEQFEANAYKIEKER